jgi:hypothetical protein
MQSYFLVLKNCLKVDHGQIQDAIGFNGVGVHDASRHGRRLRLKGLPGRIAGLIFLPLL